jgi:peptidyl-prolyl cis-trans isomerase SurA
MRVLFVFTLALLLAGSARAEKAVSDGVAVIVNDSIITYQDVEQYIGAAVDLLVRQYSRQPDVMKKKISDVRADATEQLVEHQLILHDFKTAGYQMPESIIEDTIEERIKQQYRDRVTFRQDLRARGKTYEMFHREQHDDIIIIAMNRKNVPQDVLISPQKILDFYETNKTNFAVGDQVKLRTIVLNKPPGDTGAVKQLAEEILRKINEGASFAEMAKIHSDGPQRNTGGESGWASHDPLHPERDTLRKELTEVAFSLKPGEKSRVIDLPDACWLMVVDDRRPAHLRPLSEVRDEIERALRINEASRLHKKWITRLKSKAFVRYF